MKPKECKEIIVEQLKKVPILELACNKAGISRMTFYRWQRSDPEFLKQTTEALIGGKELISDAAETQIINAIKEGHISAAIFWLKNHHLDYKPKLEISGELKNIREELTAEEAEFLTEFLNLAGFSTDNIQPNGKQLNENKHDKLG